MPFMFVTPWGLPAQGRREFTPASYRNWDWKLDPGQEPRRARAVRGAAMTTFGSGRAMARDFAAWASKAKWPAAGPSNRPAGLSPRRRGRRPRGRPSASSSRAVEAASRWTTPRIGSRAFHEKPSVVDVDRVGRVALGHVPGPTNTVGFAHAGHRGRASTMAPRPRARMRYSVEFAAFVVDHHDAVHRAWP